MRHITRSLILSAALALVAGSLKADPPQPTGLWAQPTGQQGEVSLTWTAVSASPPVTGYAIFLTPTGATPDYTQPALSVTAGASLQATGLQDGVAYDFFVVALDSSGASSLTSTAALWGDPVWPYAQPAAPTITAQVLPFGAGIWVDISGTVSAYQTGTSDTQDLGALQIEADISGGGAFDFVALAAPEDLPLTLTASDLGLISIPPSLTIRLRGLAYDSWGDSSVAGAAVALTVTGAPVASALSEAGASLLLGWTSVMGAGGYLVADGDLDADPAALLQSGDSGFVSATVTASAGNPSPTYRVYAVDAAGQTSAASNAVELLPPPTGLSAAGAPGGKVFLQWQRPLAPGQALTGYRVYRSTQAGLVTSQYVTDTGASLGLTLTGAVDGLTLTVAVASVGFGSPDDWTGVSTSAVTVSSGLALPAFYAAELSPTGSTLSTQLQLSWTASVDAGGNTPVTYYLYAYEAPPTVTDPRLATPRLVTATTLPKAIDLSRSAGALALWYGVSVSDTAQGSSGYASMTAASLLWAPCLAPPALLGVTTIGSVGSRAQLTWATVSGATAYQVWRATGAVAVGAVTATGAAGGWSPLTGGSVPASDQPAQAWMDVEAVNNTANAYAVQALLTWPPSVAGGGLGSALSNGLDVTPALGPTLPGALADGTGYRLTAVASPTLPGSVDLRWAPAGVGSSLIAYYDVRRGNSPDPNSMQALTRLAAATPSSADLVPYTDTASPPLPYSALWYAVRATDVQGRTSPGWLTGTVGSPVPWGPPIYISSTSPVGRVTLTFGPPSSQGTYGAVTALKYLVSCVDYTGAVARTVTTATFVPPQITVTDFGANPLRGLGPTYYVQAQDTVPNVGLVGPPAVIGVPLANLGNFIGTPSAVSGLSAVILDNPLAVNVSWAQNAVGEAVLNYQVFANGAPLGLTPSSVATFTDVSAGGQTWGGGVSYTVRAINAQGPGAISSPLWVSLTPPQPQGVGLSSLSVDNSLTLTWTADVNANSYQVVRTVNGVASTVASGLTSAPWTDSALPAAGASLAYAVQSVINGTVSAQALTQVSLTLAPQPAAVPALGAVAGVNGAVLAWTAAPAADAYWVYRSTSPLGANPGIPPIAALPAALCCAFTDKSAASGLLWYAVAGVNEARLGPATAASVTALPGTPLSLSATAGWNGSNATVSLGWSPPLQAGDAISGYNVYRASSAAMLAAGGAFLGNVAAPSYVDAVPSTNTAWYYGVSGVNGVESAVTPAAAVAAYAPLTEAVSGVIYRPSLGGLTVWWDPLSPSTGVSAYDLSLNGSTYSVAAGVSSAFLALTPSAGPQTLSLDAVNSAGAGPTVTMSVWANGAVQSAPPGNLTASVGFYEAVSGAARVQFNWNSPSAGTTALFYRSSSPIAVAAAAGGAASPLYLTGVPFVGSFIDGTVSGGHAYYYAVTNLQTPPGLPGGESGPVLVGPVTPLALAGPCSLSGTAGNGRVDLVWSPPPTWGSAGEPSAGATAYLLYRSAASSVPPVPVDPGFPVALSVSQTSYSDLNVVNCSSCTAGTASAGGYYYFLRAVDRDGDPSDQWAQPHQAPPNQAQLEVMQPLPPRLAPTVLTALAGDQVVNLRWVASQGDANALGTYNVYRRTLGSPDYGADAVLPWLQHVGPSAGDYPSGASGQVGQLVLTLSDPPATSVGTTLPAPGAPQDTFGYCYSLAVVNGAGEGPRSPEVCATPYHPLDAPTGVTVTTGSGAVQAGSSPPLGISWGGCLSQSGKGGWDVAGYRVYRGVNSTNTYEYAQVGSFVSVTQGTGSSPYLFSLSDTTTALGQSYTYRVVGVDIKGNEGMSSNLLEVVIPTGQNAIHLFCNAFNPAKGGVAPVQYSLQQNGHVWMKVYTLGGEFVRTLFDEQVSGASVTSPYLSAKISWDGRNDQGVTVASGVYLVHLEAPGFHSDARVAVIK